MIIREPKHKQKREIEVGDVLRGDGRCYYIIRAVNDEFPYGLVNLSNPYDYDEYKDMSIFREMVDSGYYEHYKGDEVVVEVGTHEQTRRV